MDMLKTELKTSVVKDDLNSFYIAWEKFHIYLSTITDVDKKVCIQILKAFRDVCYLTHEKVCRRILEHPDAEEREKKCPLYNLCAASGNMKGHKLYCEIARAASKINIEEVKELLKSLDDDSLRELKSIRDGW